MKNLQQNGWDFESNTQSDTNPETTVDYNDSYKILKRVDSFTNSTNKTIIINQILSRFLFNGTIEKIRYYKSDWCNENQLIETNGYDEIHLSSSGTRTTQDFIPYIAIESGKTLYSFHILPIGDWEINITRSSNSFKITMGLKSENLVLTVQPGETIELPVILVQLSTTNQIAVTQETFQKYINECIYTEVNKAIPLSYNSWFYDFDKFQVDDLKEQADAAKDLGFETFIVDAGWYGPSNDDWSLAAGDWREKQNSAFYGNMAEFSNYINSIGMDFGLWIEPEKVCKGVPILKDRPELFLKASDGIFYPDLSKTEARKYIIDIISSLINKYNVKWLKLDFNFSLGTDPHQNSFYYYMRGYFMVIKHLQKKYPEVIFENCQSGAMRADLEVNRYFDIQFLTDTISPVALLGIYSELLNRFPSSKSFKWIVLRQLKADIPVYGQPLGNTSKRIIVPKGPTWESFENCSISFLGCLALLSHTGFSGDIASLTNENRSLFTEYIKTIKKLRKECRNSIVIVHETDPNWAIFSINCADSYSAKTLVVFRLESNTDNITIKINDTEHKFVLKEKYTAAYKFL